MWLVLATVLSNLPVVEVTPQDSTSLNDSVYHLIDPAHELSVLKVLEEYENQSLSKAQTLSLGFDDATHWFVTQIENRSGETDWIFELEYPLLDQVDIYVKRDNSRLETATVGDRRPVSERYFPTRFLHIPLTMEPDERLTVAWRIQTESSMIGGARLSPESTWVRSRSTESDFRIAIYGLLFMLMFSQVLIGLWAGDRGALFIGISAGGALVTTIGLDGLGPQIFVMLPLEGRDLFTLVGVATMGTGLCQLFIHLFETPSHSRARTRLLQVVSGAYLILALLIPIEGYGISTFLALLTLPTALVLTETLIWANRQRLRVAYIADIALILMIAPPFISSQRYAGRLENSNLLDNLNAIGLGSGFLILSLAVADRLLQSRRERQEMIGEIAVAQDALKSLNRTKQNLEMSNLRLTKDMDLASIKLTQADQMATLGTMMAGVIHDMNNPLQFISDLDEVYSAEHQALQTQIMNLIGDDVGDEANLLRQQLLTRFQALDHANADLKLGTKKLKSLSEAIRNSSRRDPSASFHSLRPIVDEAVTIIGSKLKLHTISCDIADNLSIYVTRSQMSQILINLVGNARDATQQKYERNGVIDYHPWIKITGCSSVANERPGTLLTVEDNGDGITEALQEKVFEPFFTTKPVNIGTGLGLSIIKRLIESHGGGIEVTRSELGGAKFELFFPHPQADELAIILDPQKPLEASRIA